MPDLCLAGNHVCGDAGKRDREILEIRRVLIADGKGTDEVADILAVDVSRRKASEKVVLQEFSASFVVGTDMEGFVSAYVIKAVLVGQLHVVVVPFIVERDGENVFLLVFRIGI